MTRHARYLLVAALLLVGLAVAQDPGVDPDPPLRLKKKKRAGDPPPAAKDDKARPPQHKEEEPPAKGKEKEEPLIPEDGRDHEVDEKEVLERIARNMRAVEEKLSNRELGDPTAQQQRDILKDIDGLIHRQQQNQGGGGGADQPPPPQGGEQNDQEKQGGGASRQQQQQNRLTRGGSGGSRQEQRQRGARAQRQGRERPGSRQMAGGPRDGGPQQKPGGAGGTQGGMGGNGKQGGEEVNTELIKDVWGHLPESLRAEMNAYSNPRPFLPRYDDLIRKYYRTIAEQGRKRNDER